VDSYQRKKLRKTVLEREGEYCQPCRAAGKLEEATHVRLKPGAEDIEENYQALCGGCHSEQSRAQAIANRAAKRLPPFAKGHVARENIRKFDEGRRSPSSYDGSTPELYDLPERTARGRLTVRGIEEVEQTVFEHSVVMTDADAREYDGEVEGFGSGERERFKREVKRKRFQSGRDPADPAALDSKPKSESDRDRLLKTL